MTLAFAEVLRILASVAPFTGAGVGTLIKLDLRPEASSSRAARRSIWIMLALVAVSLLIVQLIAHIALRRLAGGRARERGRGAALGVDAIRGEARAP